MKNLSIRYQILAMAGGLLLLLIGVSLVSVIAMGKAARQFDKVMEIERQLELVELIREDFSQVYVQSFRFFDGEEGFLDDIRGNLKEIAEDAKLVDQRFRQTEFDKTANEAESGVRV